MRSGAEDPHVVDVELVEDLPASPLAGRRRVPVPGGAAPGTTSDGRRGGGQSRARLWSAIGALVVLVLAAWGLNHAEERRDETRLAALAGLPGYLDLITAPLEVAWRADAGRPVARTGTVLLVADAGDGGRGGGAALTALDLTTGVELWRRAVDGEVCVPLTDEGAAGIAVVSRVVCLPRAGVDAPAAGRVVVLDAATGAQTRTQTVDPSTTAELAGGHVLLTSSVAKGAVGVRAWDPVSGLDAWAFTAAPRTQVAVRDVRTAPGWSHDVRDGIVTVVGADVRLTFDAATGRRRDVPSAAPDREMLDLPGGREARWGRDRFGRPTNVVVVDRDAGSRIEVPGLPWLAPVRDGSATDVVVIRRTVDQHLLGVDAGSGRVRWDLANVPWLDASVQVDGVVVAVSPSAAVALDVATGLRLWDHPAARGSGGWDLLTDGRVVLVPTEDGDRGVVLSARRLTTGEAAWDVPLPGEVVAVDEVDGRTVLVLTDAGLVALR